ncbi:MAG: peptidylprolyl isomerase [Planctomycetota bacterium]
MFASCHLVSRHSLLALFAVSALALPSCADKSAAAGGAGAAEAPAMAFGPQFLTNAANPEVNRTAPPIFQAKFETTAGDFIIEVQRDLSPNGADRFYNLAANGFYDGVKFFRVVPGFMAQFGIHGDPAIAAAWKNANIQDDPVKQGNRRGNISFAKTGMPNSRSTQLFINFGDNSALDPQGFSSFGRVIQGMESVDKIHSGYGEQPNQMQIQAQGNAYLEKSFPKLDAIKRVTILGV